MEQNVHPVSRSYQVSLPRVVGGLLICALIAGAVAPLVGVDDDARVATTPGDFLAGADGGRDGTSGTGSTSATGAGGAPSPGGGSTGAGVSGTRSGGGGGDEAASATGAGAGVTTGGGGSPAPTEQLRASDVGITEDTIRIGAMTLDCPACAAFGLDMSGTPHPQIARAFVDEINDNGGVSGRQLELFAAGYDPVEDGVSGGGTQRAACIELTERRRVFAVVQGGITGNGCIYTEHETPLVTGLDFDAEDPDTFNESSGRLWMSGASAGRILLDWARQLDGQQLLTPSTRWGLVTDDVAEPRVRQHLLAELERLGYAPTHVTVVSGTDVSGAAVKIAQEVPIMRSKDVTHVLIATGFIGAQMWVNEAQRNGWRPQYIVSDFPSAADDFSGGSINNQGGWEGAIAVSSAMEITGLDQWRAHPVSGPCIEVFERRTGRTPATNDIGWINQYCVHLLHIFVPAMSRAGPNPTRESLVQALAGLGEFPMAALGNTGSFGGAYAFGPTKWSAVNFGQRKVWQSPCPRAGDNDNACYVPVGPVYRLAA